MQRMKIVKIILVLVTILTLFQTTAIANLPPNVPTVTGKIIGRVNISYTFAIVSTDPEGDDIGYGFCGQWSNMPCNVSLGLYKSGEKIKVESKWDTPGDYTAKVCAIDCYGHCSDFATVEIKISKNKAAEYQIFSWFCEKVIHRFSFFEKILKQ